MDSESVLRPGQPEQAIEEVLNAVTAHYGVDASNMAKAPSVYHHGGAQLAWLRQALGSAANRTPAPEVGPTNPDSNQTDPAHARAELEETRVRSRLRGSPPKHDGLRELQVGSLAQPVVVAPQSATIGDCRRELASRPGALVVAAQAGFGLIERQALVDLPADAPIAQVPQQPLPTLPSEWGASRAAAMLLISGRWTLAVAEGRPVGLLDRKDVLGAAAQSLLDGRGTSATLHEALHTHRALLWGYAPANPRLGTPERLSIAGPLELLVQRTRANVEVNPAEWLESALAPDIRLLERLASVAEPIPPPQPGFWRRWRQTLDATDISCHSAIPRRLLLEDQALTISSQRDPVLFGFARQLNIADTSASALDVHEPSIPTIAPSAIMVQALADGDVTAAMNGFAAIYARALHASAVWVIAAGRPGVRSPLMGHFGELVPRGGSELRAFAVTSQRFAMRCRSGLEEPTLSRVGATEMFKRWVPEGLVRLTALRANGRDEAYVFSSVSRPNLPQGVSHDTLRPLLSIATAVAARGRVDRELADAAIRHEERLNLRASDLSRVHEFGSRLAQARTGTEGVTHVFSYLEQGLLLEAGALYLAPPECGGGVAGGLRTRARAWIWSRAPLSSQSERALLAAAMQAAECGSADSAPAVSHIQKADPVVRPIQEISVLRAVAIQAGSGKPLGGLAVASCLPRALDAREEQVVLTAANQTSLVVQLSRRSNGQELGRLQALLDSLPLGVALVDSSGCLSVANASAAVWFAAMGVELGQPALCIGAVDLQELVATQEFVEIQSVGADGRVSTLEVSARSMPPQRSSGKGIAVMLRDVTREREQQARALHHDRLVGLGRLARGVAHDFNNYLAVILGYADLLSEELAPGSPLLRDLAEVRTAAKQAAEIVLQLHHFGSRHEFKLEPLDLNALVREGRRLLEPQFGRSADLRLSLHPDLNPMVADKTYVHQILLNLITNARDALPEGGCAVVRTCERVVPEAVASAWGLPVAAPCVVLEVEDNGVGMDARTASQIFEPYFTTKELRHGTGLGLATVREIARQLGAGVEVQSEPGVGTRFSVYFPRALPPSTAEIAHPSVAVQGRKLASAAGLRVVLFSSEPLFATQVVSDLQKAGISASIAFDLEQLRAARLSVSPDVCLVDADSPRVRDAEGLRDLRGVLGSVRAVFVAAARGGGADGGADGGVRPQPFVEVAPGRYDRWVPEMVASIRLTSANLLPSL